ncbi:MAG: TrmH family RNA methyltransferase [Microthrixaceae bacterium]
MTDNAGPDETPQEHHITTDKFADQAELVGVGPHDLPWPLGEHFDPELLENGDRRNVIDRYRYWKVQAIRDDLDGRRFSVHLAVENWEHDFNIGTVVRNANAFGAAGVHIVGQRRWNRRGAMMTDRYQHVYYHSSIEELLQWAAEEQLEVIGIDNLDGSVPLETVELPQACVLIFGQEGPGLSDAAKQACSQVCSIRMFGSTRSINAGVASGIALHTWVRTHALDPDGMPLQELPEI